MSCICLHCHALNREHIAWTLNWTELAANAMLPRHMTRAIDDVDGSGVSASMRPTSCLRSLFVILWQTPQSYTWRAPSQSLARMT